MKRLCWIQGMLLHVFLSEEKINIVKLCEKWKKKLKREKIVYVREKSHINELTTVSYFFTWNYINKRNVRSSLSEGHTFQKMNSYSSIKSFHLMVPTDTHMKFTKLYRLYWCNLLCNILATHNFFRIRMGLCIIFFNI